MRISALKQAAGGIVLLDLTELPSKLLDRPQPIVTSDAQLVALVSELTAKNTPQTSAVLLDPLFGFDAIARKANNAGLALTLAKHQSEAPPTTLPVFYPDWGVEYIRHNYGVAHLRLNYHPHEEQAAKKQQIVAELADHCRYEGIDFLLEIRLFPLDDSKTTLEEFQTAQLAALEDLAKYADLLALEYPHTALAAATITAAIDVPWLVVDATPDYGQFKEQTREALESGAIGIQIGNCLWQAGLDAADKPADQVLADLKTEARDHIIELARIVEESAAKSGDGLQTKKT